MVPGEPNAIEPVLAGSSDFVALVSPEVKSRVGAAPRVAADPRQAFSLCAEQGGLLVLEYGGPDWLPVVRDLRSLCGEDISMVVAVAPERVSEVAGLQHAGADEVVVWEGQAQSVSWAVERVLAARAAPLAAPAPLPAPAPAPRAPPQQPPARTDVFDARVEAPPVLQRTAAAPAAGPAPVPAPPAAFTIREAAPAEVHAGAPGAWPSGVLDDAEAARRLGLAVSGATPDAGPAAAAALKLAAGLTEAERSALTGAPAPFDGALLCRLAALRLRLAIALETIPAAGAHDIAAVQSLLAEVDGGLQELKSAAEAAGPEVQPVADGIRDALVGEAIAFTDAVQRLAPAAPVAVVAARPAAAPAAARAADAWSEFGPRAQKARSRGLLWALGLTLLAAAALQAYERTRPPPLVHRQTMPGAPAGAVAPSKGQHEARVVVNEGGEPFEPAEVEEFRRRMAEEGSEVIQVSPSALVVRPDQKAKKGSGGGKP